MPAVRAVDSITLEPPPETWGPLAERFIRPDSAARFRRQLGLPPRGLIVMGGHQAQFWHPGVVAKVFAVTAAARSLGATPAWLVVDHDTNTPDQIRYPVRTDALAVATWPVAPATDTLATGSRRAIVPGQPDPANTDQFVADGLRRMHDALGRSARGSLAEQFTAAAVDLIDEPGLHILRSSDLASTALFTQLLADPGALADSYNCAVASSANRAELRPLSADHRGRELPVWRLSPEGVRSPVFDSQLESIDLSTLAPRALLTTGLVRLAGCDLFVHGTGGGHETGYDRVTEVWFDDLLGATLAPSVVATATAYLPLDADTPSQEQIDRAKWLAHNARHNPALLDDSRTAEAKAQILARAEQAKADKQNPAPIFAELQHLLADYRESHADRLAQLSADADRLEARGAESAIARDRTWAFPLYPPSVIDELRERIVRAFGDATIARAT